MMNEEKLENLVNLISTMEKDDLKVASELMKERWDYLSRLEKYKFKVGDKVRFEGHGGKVETGIVIKIMKKNIRVKTDTLRWDVAPSLLEKVE